MELSICSIVVRSVKQITRVFHGSEGFQNDAGRFGSGQDIQVYW